MSSFLLLKSLDLLVKPLYPYSCWSNDCQKSHCCSSNPYVLLAKSSSGSVWMWFFPPKLAHFDREDVVFHRIKVDQSYSFACEITNLFCWLHPNNILVTNHLYFLLVTSPTFLLVTSLVMAKNPIFLRHVPGCLAPVASKLAASLLPTRCDWRPGWIDRTVEHLEISTWKNIYPLVN